MTKYTYSKNVGFGVNAQTAGEELERIREEEGGQLTPQAVVDAARSEDSPLHSVFNWDDPSAAEEHRKEQARKLIRCIRVVRSNEPPRRVYANLRQEKDEPQAYHHIKDIVNDPERRRRMLEAAWQDLIAFKARYMELLKICQDKNLLTISEIITKREMEEVS